MATTSTASRSDSHSRTRSQNNNTTIPSRPTTPLRPPSRTSLRASQSTTTPTYNPRLGTPTSPSSSHKAPGTVNTLDPLSTLEPAFAELSDNMADLEANFMHLQLLNESLGRFTENFGAFLYGMNMSAFCVDFPEAPIPQSFSRHSKDTAAATSALLSQSPFRTTTTTTNIADTDATFLTTDTSFVENPPASSSKPPSTATSSRRTIGGPSSRGGIPTSSSRGGRGGRGGHARTTSGIARGTSSRGRGGRVR